MSTTTTNYLADVVHPTMKQLCGQFQFRVIKDGNAYRASADKFGYSRDYWVSDGKQAIAMMLREHGCWYTSCKADDMPHGC